MKSFLAATLLFTAPVLAATPEWEKGGVVVALQYGWGMWSIDQPKLASNPQVGTGNAAVLANDTTNGHSATFRLGYNILGHATVEAAITATGWRLTEQNRGGGGFLTGGAHWHPLQLADALIDNSPLKERFYDLSFFLGFGYGIQGQTAGMDGFAWQWGLGLDFFLAKTIALGLFYRSYPLSFGSFYFDYNNRSVAGNTVSLPNGSGGSFAQVGVTLTLRVSP